MNLAADGGGGGGVDSLVVDHAALSGVAGSLTSAAGTFDDCGTSAPSTGNLGDAAALITTILAAVNEAGARIAFESTTLGAVVEECNAVVASADRSAAESYLVTG